MSGRIFVWMMSGNTNCRSRSAMKLLNLKSVFVSEVSWLLLGHLLLQISFLSPLNSFLYQDIWWGFFSQAVSCLNGPFRQISPILASSLPCLSILNVHAPLVPTSVAIALLSFPPTFDVFLAWLSHDFRCVTLHLTFCVGSFSHCFLSAIVPSIVACFSLLSAWWTAKLAGHFLPVFIHILVFGSSLTLYSTIHVKDGITPSQEINALFSICLHGLVCCRTDDIKNKHSLIK